MRCSNYARGLLGGLAIACSSERTNAPPAPPLVTVDGVSFRLDTFLWRDFMPISPPDGKPLVAVLRILTTDGSSIPASVAADSVWVYNGSEVWATAVVEEQPRNNSYFEVVAREGPKWGPGIEVDVVVRLRDGAGHRFLLQARRQLISRTD